MTWAKISDAIIDDPVLLGLPRGVRLLHVEAIVWCSRHGTDGVIPDHVLTRITDEPQPYDAAAELLMAGVWTVTEAGYRIREMP